MSLFKQIFTYVQNAWMICTLYFICLAMNKYILFLFVFLAACTPKQYKSDTYTLIPTEYYYICNLDNETRVPLHNLYLIEQDSLEFLTFSDPATRSILIYNIPSGGLEKKLTFPIEGSNGIGAAPTLKWE